MHVPAPAPVLDLKACNATTGTPRMKWRQLSQNQRAEASTNKNLLLDAYCSKIINDTGFLLLYDIYSRSHLHLSYWKYDRFSLENMNDNKYEAEFGSLEKIYTHYMILSIFQECSHVTMVQK